MIKTDQVWLIFMGCNGSGKTTLAWRLKEVLEKQFGKCLLFDLGRFLTEDPTYASQIAAGDFVQDDEVLQITIEHMALAAYFPFRLLIGWPRNLDQAKQAVELIRSRSEDRVLVVHVDAPYHVCQDRMRGQVNRPDNTDEARGKRIRKFKELTVPAIDHMKSEMRCISVDGSLAPEDVLRDAMVKLFPYFTQVRVQPEPPLPLLPLNIPQASA